MKKCLLAFAVLVCAVCLAGAARADLIPFAYSGPGVSVSGTLFGSDNANGSWTITGIDATYNQIQVAGIVANGLDPHFLYNNLYYDSGYAPFAVDYYGIVFAVPGLGDVNLCSYGRQAAAALADTLPSYGTAAATSSRRSSSPKSTSQTQHRRCPSRPPWPYWAADWRLREWPPDGLCDARRVAASCGDGAAIRLDQQNAGALRSGFLLLEAPRITDESCAGERQRVPPPLNREAAASLAPE